MNTEKFTKIVTNRAHERVVGRIAVFKAKIAAAVNELFLANHEGIYYLNSNDREFVKNNPHVKKVFEVLCSEDIKNGWPSILWRNEEELVAKEIMAILNEVEKASMAKGYQDGDPMPEVEVQK